MPKAPPKGQIYLPPPLEHQIPILEDRARCKIICAGRRWGKEATVPQNEPIRVVWTKHWRTRGVPPEPEPLPTGSE